VKHPRGLSEMMRGHSGSLSAKGCSWIGLELENYLVWDRWLNLNVEVVLGGDHPLMIRMCCIVHVAPREGVISVVGGWERCEMKMLPVRRGELTIVRMVMDVRLHWWVSGCLTHLRGLGLGPIVITLLLFIRDGFVCARVYIGISRGWQGTFLLLKVLLLHYFVEQFGTLSHWLFLNGDLCWCLGTQRFN
jgi:hypothetical protein